MKYMCLVLDNPDDITSGLSHLKELYYQVSISTSAGSGSGEAFGPCNAAILSQGSFVRRITCLWGRLPFPVPRASHHPVTNRSICPGHELRVEQLHSLFHVHMWYHFRDSVGICAKCIAVIIITRLDKKFLNIQIWRHDTLVDDSIILEAPSLILIKVTNCERSPTLYPLCSFDIGLLMNNAFQE